ncbi:ribosome biogenesis GTPase Der [bacterium]|nr:ribosome biogenesis GTPase Der [bacterium]
MKSPRIAIVGRPNVGKSTLFNRLVGERRAIVDDRPGITRDRIYGRCEWGGIVLTVIDTGGYSVLEPDDMFSRIAKNVETALSEADLVLFVVDARAGLMPEDEKIALMLRKLARPVVVAVNKIDNLKQEELLYDFYPLALEPMLPVSALHGTGSGDLLDAILEQLPDASDWKEELPEGEIAVSIVGRPNVGKSTLLNRLLGADRSLVAPEAGTTRDPVDGVLTYMDQRIRFVDTAGIRRRGKQEGVEKWSVLRATQAIKESDVALLMMDALEGPTETDAHVFSVAHDAGCAAILIVNKWDAIEKDTETSGRFAKKLREDMPYLHYAPIVTLSALTGLRVHALLEHILAVHASHRKRVTTGELNRLIERVVTHHPPAARRGRRPRIYYATQVAVAPPKFVLFSNHPEAIHFSYQRYITNQLYETFGFAGTPLVVEFRAKKRWMAGEGW